MYPFDAVRPMRTIPTSGRLPLPIDCRNATGVLRRARVSTNRSEPRTHRRRHRKQLVLRKSEIKMAVSRLSIVKFLELALTIACVILHYQSYNTDADIGMLVTGTFVGFLIIFAGAAAGYVMQTSAHKRIDIFYTLVGVVMFVASGVMLLDRYNNAWKGEYRNKNMIKASLAIVNGVVLLVDGVLTQRGG